MQSDSFLRTEQSLPITMTTIFLIGGRMDIPEAVNTVGMRPSTAALRLAKWLCCAPHVCEPTLSNSVGSFSAVLQHFSGPEESFFLELLCRLFPDPIV